MLLGWLIKNPVAGHWDFASWRLGSVLGRLGLCYFITSCIALAPGPSSHSRGERNRTPASDEASAAPWLDRRRAHDVREDAWRGEGLCGRRLAREVPELASGGTPRQCAIVVAVQFVYLLLVLLLHAPGCPAGYFGAGCVHADSGGTCIVPDRDSATNASLLNCSGGATGYIDRQLLGPAHMRRTTCAPAGCEGVDPNGAVAVLPSILHVFIGLTIGRAIRFLVLRDHASGSGARLVTAGTDRSNDGGSNRAQPRAWVRLLSWASACAAIGGIASVWLPVNKLLWSLSFVFFTSAIACVLLAALHWSIDERQLWRGGVLRAVGVNPIVLYLGSEVFDSLMDNFFVGTATCKLPSDGGRCSLKDIVLQNGFEHGGLSSDGAHAFYGVLLTCFWLAIGFWLDRSGVHITI